MRIEPEVAAALRSGRPVVALESAVITHGLPRPRNAAIAREIEAAVRAEGALPATVAVLDGEPRVGLTSGDLDRLADDGAACKCATRDLPLAVAARCAAGTTVSATARIAYAAGIAVFATGGIGGVHRGGAFDVSADLVELGRAPITVVCSGAKSLLDLSATLEALETQGVAVLGYGTEDFPAFHVASSGLPATARVDGPAEVAAVARARDRLGLSGAILVAVPVPTAHGMEAGEVERLAEQATEDAAASGVAGPALTPWVLARMAELSSGRTLAANQALLVNNARVAARIAIALALPYT